MFVVWHGNNGKKINITKYFQRNFKVACIEVTYHKMDKENFVGSQNI